VYFRLCQLRIKFTCQTSLNRSSLTVAISALHSLRTNFHVLRHNFLKLAHRGDLGPLHTLRTKDSPRSIARHWFTHAAKRQGSPHNLWPTRLLSEPPFFTRAAQLQGESARLARAACGTNGARRAAVSWSASLNQSESEKCLVRRLYGELIHQGSTRGQGHTAGESLVRLCSGTTH